MWTSLSSPHLYSSKCLQSVRQPEEHRDRGWKNVAAPGKEEVAVLPFWLTVHPHRPCSHQLPACPGSAVCGNVGQHPISSGPAAPHCTAMQGCLPNESIQIYQCLCPLNNSITSSRTDLKHPNRVWNRYFAARIAGAQETVNHAALILSLAMKICASVCKWWPSPRILCCNESRREGPHAGWGYGALRCVGVTCATAMGLGRVQGADTAT